LNARDTRRVEEALERDPVLARQYASVRDELAETIHLNEELGAPSARAMQKLFAGIDAEPARKPAFTLSLSAKLTEFLASLSPRAIAYAGGAAAIALLLQAAVIGAVLTKGGSGGSFQTASYQSGQAAPGAYALVRFQPTATAADIATFLDANKASIVDGPKAGMFRIRVGSAAASGAEMTQLVARLQGEKVVSFVAAAE
jgi:hypothetical protein